MTREHIVSPAAMSLAVHELRTPVTVLAGYLRMLLREQGGPLSDKQRKMLEEAERSCGRLGALVAELSEFGKLEAGELTFGRQELDLGTLLLDVASDMHEGEDRGVRLEVRRADLSALAPSASAPSASTSGAAGTPITGDRARLSAVLHILLRSVLRERGEPGTVVAALDTVTSARTAWAVVAVGPEADISEVIAFAATAPPPPCDDWRGGLGFLLPIARRVVDAHGGALWSGTLSLWPRTHSQSQAVSALRLPLRTG